MTTVAPSTRPTARAPRTVRRLRPTPAWWRASSRDALVVSLLLVTGLWAVPHGVADLAGGPAAALTSLGRLAGLVASDLLLVQVLLMARVPLVERAWGQDELARVHRLVGFASFDLMLVHVALIGLGYAGGDSRGFAGVLGELWDMTWNLPGVLLAVAGSVCLVLVVVTSVRAARRRLRYESWHLLHLYAYLGVGLALPHQLWTGQEFLASTGRTVFWWALWAAAAGAVLVFRLGVPVLRNGRHRLRVATVVPEAPGVVSVHVTGRALDRFPAEPGQFLLWRFLDGPGWTRAHPWSLSAAPDGRSLRITVQVAGDGGARLAHLRPGTRVLVEGPFGRLSPRSRTRPGVALIGAGVGVAPLRALAEGLAYAPGEAVLLYRSARPPLFAAEFDGLARHRGLRLLWLPGHRRAEGSWLGDGVRAADDLTALTWWVPDIAERDVYVCGPQAWADDVRRTVLAAGVPADRLHLESFGW